MTCVPVLFVDGKKPCSKCKRLLPVSMYHKMSKARSGYKSSCKECRKSEHEVDYKEHKEARLLAGKKWRERNRERMTAIRKRWVDNNKKGFAAMVRAWEQKNRDAKNSHGRNYQARKKNAKGSHSKSDITLLLQYQKGKCAVCRDALGGTFDVDHVVPLSRGGENDKYNLQLLCVTCNRTKNKQDPILFMQKRGYLL